MPHITFLTETFFPSHRAGTEIYVLNLAKNLINAGYKVSVITPAIGEKNSSYLHEKIPVYTFSVPLKISAKEMNGITKLSGLEEYKTIIKKLNPDILHVHTFSRSINYEHLKIAKQNNIKTVFTPHLGGNFCVKGDFRFKDKQICNGKVENIKCLSCFLYSQKKIEKNSEIIAFIINLLTKIPIVKKLIPAAYHIVKFKKQNLNALRKYSDINIAISQWIKDVFLENNIQNVSLINQGINTDIFKSKKQTANNNENINITFIGRMHYSKGIHLLLDAIYGLKQNTFILRIITSATKENSDYFAFIKQKIKKFKNVILKESITQNEVSKILDETDIFCLPSISSEMSPLVILEAFAKGIPVIGSTYPAIKDMVKHDYNGLLFENNNYKDLQIQLERLQNDPDLIKKLSDNVVKPRSFFDVSKEHIDLYLKLLS
ncbi:MAG: glycosyltransferase [Bacteroidota bacterium]|nr:glycosyltransferase [Bacteroidota bacterium]